MNQVERLIRRVDTWQQRHKPAAFTFGVMKKFGDDNAGQLVASLSHAAFVSLFPLLLVLVTILGIVAAGNHTLRMDVLNAVAKQFPLIGAEFTRNVHQLRRSSVAGLIVGLLIVIWGTSGLAQSGMFTMAQVWNLPGPDRPGYWQRLGRTGLFLVVLAVSVIVTTGLASLSAFGHHSAGLLVGATALALAANVGMYVAGFRVLTPKGIPVRDLVPGAVLAGVAWTILQELGALVVSHYLHSDSVYGIFGIVLSLLAWIYLVVEITVYAAEVNVVLVRKLWPRSILQPPLTDADRAALALQPLQNQRREDQRVVVSFTDQPPGSGSPGQAPRTPDEVAPPAQRD
jgi:YihY family inner membrane protein